MLGKLPVFFPVFIVPMKVCRCLAAISVDNKKNKVKKEHEGVYSFKYTKHGRDRPKHEVTEPAYIGVYKLRVFTV